MVVQADHLSVSTVLLQMARTQVRRGACSGELRGDAEDRVDELALSNDIAFGDPPNLTFTDSVRRLVAFDRSASAFYRSESEVRGYPVLVNRWSCSITLFK